MMHARMAVLLAIGLVLSLTVPVRAGAQDAAALLGLDSLLNLRVSTAAKYAQTVTEAASSVTIITSEDIDRYGYRTLEDALATVSGFHVSNDRAYATLGARGFSRQSDYNVRILLLIDGNTVNESVWGSAPLGSELGIPLRSLERIEIVRGPGSVLYGTGAAFAVVNLVTRSATQMDGGEVAVEGGSYGRRAGTLLFGRELGNGTGVTLGGTWDGTDGQDLYYQEYDAPATNDGVARNADWERRWNVYGGVTRGGLAVRGRLSSRLKAIPTGSFGADFTLPSTIRDQHGAVQVSYDRGLGAARYLSLRSYLNTFALDSRAFYGGSPVESFARGTLVGAEAALRWDLASGNRLTLGGEGRRALRSEFVTVGSTDLRSRYTVVSAYVQDEQQLSRTLTALAGLRLDHYSTTGEAVTPRVALIFAPTDATTLKLLYGEAFRAPSLNELAMGTDTSGAHTPVEPERTRTFEVLWQQRLGHGLLGSLSVYRYHARRLIEAQLDSTNWTLHFFNSGTAKATGAEVGLEARLGARVTGYGSYAYQNARDDATEARLTNSPMHQVKGGVSVQPLPWLRPAIEARYESARRTSGGTATDPYVLTNMHVTLSRGLGARVSRETALDRIELSLRLNNAFDVTYATPGSADLVQDAIAQNGRHLSAELRYKF